MLTRFPSGSFSQGGTTGSLFGAARDRIATESAGVAELDVGLPPDGSVECKGDSEPIGDETQPTNRVIG